MDNKEYIQSQYEDVIARRDEIPTKQSSNARRSFASARDDKESCSRVATLLVNFGGPTNLKEVTPFLYNLFSDPVVLNFPFICPTSQLAARKSQLFSLYRNPLAYLIANTRSFFSCGMYKKIGGASPLVSITYLQAEKLQALFSKNDLSIDVFVSFRYSKPYIEDKLTEIAAGHYKKIVVLPLYPQYSYTTTGSVQLIISDWLKKNNTRNLELYFISNWFKDEDYIQAHVNLIKNSLEDLDLRRTEILFSAHSIPYFNLKRGDPYQRHITETAKRIIDKLNWKKRWQIAYQSRIGPLKWLEPSTPQAIKEIAKRNPNTSVLLIPISFVCDQVETIYEIDILYKEIAKRHGIKNFVRAEALNTDKYLIQALYNQAIGCLESNQIGVKELLLTRNP